MFKKKDLPKVEPVVIKSLFGLKPGLWLTIAYALAFCIILFLVGFLPDILDGSKRVSFTSSSYNCAVYVDDVYVGGTPFTKKIKSGEHTVSFKINGHEIDSMNVKISHPVFFNWLFPRKQVIHSDALITEDAYKALCAELLEDSNAYSAILEYDYTHPYNPIFTTFAKTIKKSSFSNQKDILSTAFLFTTTDEMYNDAIKASELLGLDIDNLFSTLDDKQFVGVADNLKPNISATKTSLDTPFFTIEGFEIENASFSNGKKVAKTYPDVNEAGVFVSTDAFNISSYCITEQQFSYFIKENPTWSLENKEALIKEGLVDQYYLDGVNISTSIVSLKPVRNISYYAATSFCKWLSSVTGKNVYLPSENQWLSASLTDNEEGYQKSITPSKAENAPSSMLGGLWEMTSTYFIPLSRLADEKLLNDAYAMLDKYNVQADMIVKGGSYANEISSIDHYSVGTAYRSLCSDFMGFRIAWD